MTPIKYIPASICLLLLLAANVGAQKAPKTNDRHTMTKTKPSDAQRTVAPLPKLGAPHALQLPAVVQKSLPNGLKIVILEDHSQPAIWIRLAVKAGSIYDPQNRVGLARMTAQLLDKGTATRSEADIADVVDGLGASVGAGASDDYMTISGEGLSANTDKLFDIASDITLHPSFPEVELDRARTRTLNSITSSLAEPSALADAAINRLVYGAHPYGNFSAGTPATLPQIKREDLVNFHAAYFSPNRATLFVAGDITADEAVRRATAVFGAWENKAEVASIPTPKSTVSKSAQPQLTLIDRPGAAQTQIRIGAQTPGYNDPNRFIGRVATAVLGLGQFEGRLMQEIRVKRGLTYSVASFFNRKAQAGEFEISTYTKNKTTAEVIKLALAETQKMRHELASSSELQDRKNFLNGSFAVSVATLPGVLTRLTPAVLNGAGPSELTEYVSKIQGVTSQQVMQLMNSLPLDKPQIVLVGDAKEIEAQLTGLGQLTKISADKVDLQSPTLQPTKSAAAESGTKATPEELKAGKAMLMATIQAHGGDKFLNLKSVVLMKGKGELSPPGQTIKLPVDTATITLVSPGKSRYALTTGFGDIIFGSSGGGQGWLVAMGGAPKDAPFAFGDPMELVRRASADNYETRILPDMDKLHGYSITDPAGHVAKIYVDPDTSLLRHLLTGVKGSEAAISLSDYHDTEGVKLPGSLQIDLGGKPVINLKFTDFSINKPVDAKIFDRPKE